MSKLRRALAIAMTFVVLMVASAKAQNPAHTNCADFQEAPVGIFVSTGCTPTAEWWPIYGPWKSSLEGESLDDALSSIFVKEGWSVRVSEDPDGSGLTACLADTKWAMDEDVYPDSEVKMGNSISYLQVFENADCTEEAVSEPLYCDSLNYVGVVLFNKKACESPGAHLIISKPKHVDLGKYSEQISSIFISEGWSAKVSDGSHMACFGETKWDLWADFWPETEIYIGDSVTDVVVFDALDCGIQQPPAEETKTYCSSMNYVGVVLFDKPACEQPGGHLVVSQPGVVNMMQFAGQTSSVYVSSGWSAKVSDGSHMACFGETKWDLMSDMWPETKIFIGDSITEVTVYNVPNCGKQEPAEEETKTYCDSLSFAGVGLFDLISCEQPGMVVTTTVTGTVSLGAMSGIASSVYMSDGWSILASNGDEDYCLIGSKWDLSKDKWPSGQVQNNSIISATVFANNSCKTTEPISDEQEKTFLPEVYTPMASTYCDSLSFAGVGLFNAKSCQMPGQSATTDREGGLSFNFSPRSVYVAPGYSVLVAGDGIDTCLSQTKWDLTSDSWPGTTRLMTDILVASVHHSSNCAN